MAEKLKVLVLAMEPWRGDDSGGNTLNNFFEGMKGVEFAHIWCGDRMPDNNVCKKYFHIPEAEMPKSFFTRRKVGREIQWPLNGSNGSSDSSAQGFKRNLIRKVKELRPYSIIKGRNFLRRYSNWKTPELRKFIEDFNPDVIYAPCYASPYQLTFTRYVNALTGKKIITWSADDCYSLRQFSLSPFYWLNRFWVRHCLRKTYPCYDEFYSISEEEIEEMSPVVGQQMKVLRKGVVVPETFTPREVHQSIRFIYAGGLYLNRYKILIEIANTLRELNKDGVKAELHVYSGSQLGKKDMALLSDGRSSFMHGLITPAELSQRYQECDVAIHCESFQLKYRLGTRLSFSTKIIDCFQSGCAILAIAWKEHTGMKVLQRNDAAFCVTSVKDISATVERVVTHPELIKEYAVKAYECEKKNHRIEDVQKTLYDAFVRCSK